MMGTDHEDKIIPAAVCWPDDSPPGALPPAVYDAERMAIEDRRRAEVVDRMLSILARMERLVSYFADGRSSPAGQAQRLTEVEKQLQLFGRALRAERRKGACTADTAISAHRIAESAARSSASSAGAARSAAQQTARMAVDVAPEQLSDSDKQAIDRLLAMVS